MAIINVLLTIYVWSVVCLHLFFMMLIARFYEDKSGQRSFYPYFLIPAFFLAGAAIRYAFLPFIITGDLWGDIFRAIGGLMAMVLVFFLLKLMMGRQ